LWPRANVVGGTPLEPTSSPTLTLAMVDVSDVTCLRILAGRIGLLM
jgi:hypothetical protein